MPNLHFHTESSKCASEYLVKSRIGNAVHLQAERGNKNCMEARRYSNVDVLEPLFLNMGSEMKLIGEPIQLAALGSIMVVGSSTEDIVMRKTSQAP